jgi:ATP-dependent exoDNAse (exonuclease V) beta subunit
MTANIDLISASAGSGKTYRLANEIIKAIGQGVPPERIVATTFTNKAAAELIQRIRFFLLKA